MKGLFRRTKRADGSHDRRRRRSFLIEFLRTEAGGGVTLLAATLLALAWANSPLSNLYEAWTTGSSGYSGWLPLDAKQWINEGLMTVFFFIVGLEIKWEFTHGELKDPKRAALPLAGAVGGMMLPAGIYLLINAGGAELAGWPVPMATDIAFAIGLVSLLGKLVPLPIKLFILTLAIADDLGAVAVIAISSPEKIRIVWLAVAAACVAAATLSRALWTRSPWTVFAVGVLVWLATFRSGVHPTVAGVALAFMIPSGPEGPVILERFENALHPWSSFVIMPLFAIANAGVDLSSFSDAVRSRVALGVVLGLVAGKTLGIFGAAWLAVRFRLAKAPPNIRNSQLLGAAAICGMGFTVSLFMANLVFEGEVLATAKMGILAGTLLSAALGSLILWGSQRAGRRPGIESGSTPKEASQWEI